VKGKAYTVEGVKILVTSFHLSWGGSDERLIIGMRGTVSFIERGEPGAARDSWWSTKFDLTTGLKSKLTFKDAMIFGNDNPNVEAIALTVKRTLITFVRECPLIPVEFREQAAQTILKQHEQGKS
jgi:hypothetical protein